MPIINLGNRRKRDFTRNKSALQAWYNTPTWKRLRFLKFRENPICEVCEARSVTSVTTEVHHITPIDIGNPDPGLIFGWDNLICLCTECHKKVHNYSQLSPIDALTEMKREVR